MVRTDLLGEIYAHVKKSSGEIPFGTLTRFYEEAALYYLYSHAFEREHGKTSLARRTKKGADSGA